MVVTFCYVSKVLVYYKNMWSWALQLTCVIPGT
jgi:hypothetical protein